MKYLKMVNSFDEFAEDAMAGVVYYHIDESTYYWLNLKTIWGYIGYDVAKRQFFANGKEWSIIPSVPDPENLTGPVRINSGSFDVAPKTITFNYSPFSIFPLGYVESPGSTEARYRVYCGNTYPLENTELEITDSSHGLIMELIDTDLSKLKKIGNVAFGRTNTIVINDSNGLIDISTITFSNEDRAIRLLVEKNITTFSENDILTGIQEGMNRTHDGNVLYSWSTIWRVIIPEGVTTHVAYLHHYIDGKPKMMYSVDSLPSTLATLIIDCADSNGIVNDGQWYYMTTSSKKYENVIYRNCTDVGNYYYRYLISDNFKPVTSEMMSYLRQHPDRLVMMYANSSVRNYTSDPVASWQEFSGKEYDLKDINTFVYYPDTNPPYSTQTVTYPVHVSDFDNTCVIGLYYATPKLSNVNLDYFRICKQTSTSVMFIRTDDSDVHIGKLYFDRYCSFVIGDCDIHITGTYYNGLGSIRAVIVNDECSGHVVLENYEPYMSYGSYPYRTLLEISNMGKYSRTDDPYFDLSNLTGKANPTPDDYYATGVDTNHVVSVDGGEQYCNIMLVYRNSGWGKSYGSHESILANWALLKCYYPEGDTYISYYSGLTATELTYFVDAIPNVKKVSKINFSSAQYALLTSAQIDKMTNLGYTVVEIIN